MACEQLVEDDAKTVNVAARIDVAAAELHLLGAHVRRCSKELIGAGQACVFVESLLRRLGNPEINHLRDGHAFELGNKNVRGLQVAMNNALLMRMLHGVTNRNE